MSKKRTSKDVAILEGFIWNDNTRTVANAVNYNAQILKNAMDRIAELERQLADMRGEEDDYDGKDRKVGKNKHDSGNHNHGDINHEDNPGDLRGEEE